MKKVLLIALATLTTSVVFAQGHQSEDSPKLNTGTMAWLIGTWAGKQKFETGGAEPMVADTTLKVTSVVGGRFLEERSFTVLPGGRVGEALHVLTYDRKAGAFKIWWYNDTQSDPRMLLGTVDTNHKLVLNSYAATIGAHTMTFRATYNPVSNSHLQYTVELNEDGKWRKLFTTDYTKQPK